MGRHGVLADGRSAKAGSGPGGVEGAGGRTGAVRLRGLGRRFGWGLADQAVSNLTNLAVSLYVARTLGAVQFGAFRGITMPRLMLQDSWRYAFFAHGRGGHAFLNDTIWAQRKPAAIPGADRVMPAQAERTAPSGQRQD